MADCEYCGSEQDEHAWKNQNRSWRCGSELIGSRVSRSSMCKEWSDEDRDRKKIPRTKSETDSTAFEGDPADCAFSAGDKDAINPSHYTEGKVECIEAIEAIGIGQAFCRGNAIKYLWRLGKKGDALEDAKKAKWYIERLIKQLENERQNQ